MGFSLPAAETEGRRRIVSKSFHHQLKYHEKQSLVGELTASCDCHVTRASDHVTTSRSAGEHERARGGSRPRNEKGKLENVPRLPPGRKCGCGHVTSGCGHYSVCLVSTLR